MARFTEIAPEHLMRRLGGANTPTILDVRLPEDRAALPALVPAAQKLAHNDAEGINALPTDQDYVVICHKGKKLSHGVASLLRARGAQAEVLEGGQVAWDAAGMPQIPIANSPASSLWVTRARPKIDRIACPWLIRRFIDPAARFLFVPAAEVVAVAQRFDAIAFDSPGADLGHDGPLCTFDTVVTRFGLSHEALDRMALVIRAADTDTLDAAPQAAGLLAISVGLSRLHKDDIAQLNAAMPLYDALYRWARDGFAERHDSQGSATS